MVFVHPNPFDNTCWMYQTAHFQTWFRCISIDLPGYGRSPTASPGLTMPDVAQACWEAVDDVTDEPAVLVGLSVGSNVVLHMHAQQPERTLAMIHTGCSYRPVKHFAFLRKAQYTEHGIDFRREHAFVGSVPSSVELSSVSTWWICSWNATAGRTQRRSRRCSGHYLNRTRNGCMQTCGVRC
jgi:pimeloyl-ACP methyl ester carboxylesterase